MGVRIGMTPSEVEALNGEPFQVGGFGWDYGGYGQLETGALADLAGDCYLSIRFGVSDDIPATDDTDKIWGEVQIASSEPILDTVGARVEVISLGYAWPADLPQPQY